MHQNVEGLLVNYAGVKNLLLLHHCIARVQFSSSLLVNLKLHFFPTICFVGYVKVTRSFSRPHIKIGQNAQNIILEASGVHFYGPI